MAETLLDALELIARGSVATTGLAIGQAGADLTFPQWRVLVVVKEYEEGATVSEIASRVGGHVSPVSRLVGRLERRGLVRTEKDPRDRRGPRGALSERGDELRSPVLARPPEVLAPAIAAGNAVVMLPSEAQALIATDLYQVLDTSDVPGGVDERAGAAELLGALARGKLPLPRAPRTGFLAAGMERLFPHLLQPLELARRRFMPVCHCRGA